MFMLFLCLLICMILVVSTKVGSFRNLMTVFGVFWIIMIAISKFLSPLLFDVNEETYLLMYTFIIMVNIGFLFVAKNKLKYEVLDDDNQKNFKVFRFNKFSLVIQIAVLILLLFYLFKYNQIKNHIPIYQLRIVRYQVGYLFSSGSELLIYNYFIASFVELMGLLAIVKVVITHRIDKNIVISIFSLLIFSLIGLGRFGLFNAVFFVFGAFFFLPIFFKKDVQNRNSGKKIAFSIILILLLLLFMVLIGSSRSISELNNMGDLFSMLKESFNQAMLYFTAPFRALDFFINNRSMSVNNLSGRAFFSGIDEFFNFILSFLGFSNISSNTIISELTKAPILVGNDIYFNAFYTAIFNAYLDGGILGVIICGLILGIFAGITWNFYMRRKNYFSFALIVYFALMLISTEYRFEFQQFKSFVIIGTLVLLAKKIKSKR